MKIDIIGANTQNGIKLRNIIIEIANSLDNKLVINLINNQNINNLPCLYINDILISKGKIPNKKDIVKFLKNNYKE